MRFDKVEADIDAVKNSIEAMSEKSDRIIEMLGEMIDSQMQARNNISYLEEKQAATIELFHGVSGRVNVLESMLTPTPGSGPGNGKQ